MGVVCIYVCIPFGPSTDVVLILVGTQELLDATNMHIINHIMIL